MFVLLCVKLKDMVIVCLMFCVISNFCVDRCATSVSMVWTKTRVVRHATEGTTQAALSPTMIEDLTCVVHARVMLLRQVCPANVSRAAHSSVRHKSPLKVS